MLTPDDLNQIREIVQDTVLDSEKRIRMDMVTKKDLNSAVTELKVYMEKYTEDGVQTVVDTLDYMFPEKSPHLKPKSKVIN